MKRFMRKFRKQFRYGEKGFTLIELLVVVAILGVLAAVVVPNVVKFMGTGTVESANTEAHDVQLGVVAYMADNNLTACSGTVGPTSDIGPAVADGTTVHSFLVNPARLQADYTIGGTSDTEGEITAAAPITGSKWTDLTWTTDDGWS